ncbi:MAG: hypothetical protein ACKVHO_21125 [Verrucomicrobiia bacterium]
MTDEKFGGGNNFKIRCIGKYPVITTWINGVKICQFNTGTLKGIDTTMRNIHLTPLDA